jgi:RNA recognition motif-containing protein
MNLYVGNLSFDTDEQSLRRLFADYGTVTSARIITDRDTGRSRGFGFVELEDDSAARKAIEELNGADLDGRTLTINEARPREPRQQRSRW